MTSYLTPDRWHLGFNDPTVMGWLLTLEYLFVSVCCGLAARAENGTEASRFAWALLALALGMICLNKQLDLQEMLQDWGRRRSVDQGWYRYRKEVLALILTTAVVAILLGAKVLRRLLPRPAKQLQQALPVFFLLLVVILVRFLPIRLIAGVLDFTLFKRESGVWQLHVVELFELIFVSRIGVCALRRSRERAG